jgi:hypothetical protein
MSFDRVEYYDLRFLPGTRFIIIGPSGSGKTEFVMKLLRYQKIMFKNSFSRVVYIYGQSEPETTNFPDINFEKIYGIENIEEKIESFDSTQNNGLILDDVMNEVGDQKIISDLFTKISRHKNITVFLLLQNLFPKGKYFVDISRNANYIVLMTNPRDISQIKTLEQQIFGKSSSFLLKSYIDAIRNKPFGYLFLDFNQTTSEKKGLDRTSSLTKIITLYI